MRRLSVQQWLIKQGWVDTPDQVKDLISKSLVFRNGFPIEKSSTLISDQDEIFIKDPNVASYVSRGGEKISAAFKALQEKVDPEWYMDVGASTGGFSDYLLQEGAKGVVAIDVGTHQLHEKLRNHPSVISMEQTHILEVQDLLHVVYYSVIDVSFISLRRVFPHVWNLLSPPRWCLMLFKPQFELPPKYIGKGGVVRDQAEAEKCLGDFLSFLNETYHPPVLKQDLCDIRGKKKGNQEYWILIKE